MTATVLTEATGDPICGRPPPRTEVQLRAYDLERLVDRVQQHVCSSRSSCQKNGKCRFDFPKPIQEETVVERDESKGYVQISFHHRRDNDATNNYNSTMLSTWRANMDIKIIGNAYGAAEYVAAYVSKSEPDSVRFYRTIEAALSKIPSGVPRERLLKRTANTLLAMREVSAQEAIYILSNTLCLYGKSRTVLKVKVSRHDRRYYRISHDHLGNPSVPSSDADGIRVEEVEMAYMQRPHIPLFESITFREFCEGYIVSKDKPKDSQRLERWKRLDDRGYIKCRTQKQLVRPSPRYRTDEENADYCYAQLFLHRPWRVLGDIPVEDGTTVEAYRQWKAQGTSSYSAHIDEQAERESSIASAEHARESSMALPSPQWSIRLDANSFSQTSTEAVLTARVPFASRFQYSEEDIMRAKTFLKDALCERTQTLEPGNAISSQNRPYVYPTADQSPVMSSDQWMPFAMCMAQSRRRALAATQKTDCNPMQMIVCGEGGTGKSWLIQHIIEDLRVVFGAEEAKKKVLIMAHQGSAAFLVGGRTIASALSFAQSCNFRGNYEAMTEKVGGQASLQRLQQEYEDVHLVIVDEFGTVSSGMLHWMDRRLREIFPAHNGAPFGGRDMIFTGDPGQLGPVKLKALSIPEKALSTVSECEGRSLWEKIDLYFELKQQNRGCSDPEWFSMLARVRRGLPQPGDIELINTRVVERPRSRKNVTYLAYRNVDVAEANTAALHSSSASICHISAHHEVHFSASQDDQRQSNDSTAFLLREAPEMTSASAKYLPAHLDLAIGAPMTLTYNLEQRLGLCNGSKGIVYDIMHDPHGTQPIVLVRMQDYKGPSFVANVSNVVPVICRSASLVSGKKSPYRLYRTALPLRLGYATTIHKSQGQTCATVVLNPTKLQSSALAYVALSRARNRSDVFITAPMTESQLKKTPEEWKIDDDEEERVSKLIADSTRTALALVPRMVSKATAYNRWVEML